ncbi:MAG: adenosylmethionine--8-amino-7-oxononanoate transaminase [Planctomycetota bacterium]
MTSPTIEPKTQTATHTPSLAQLDHDHVWHPFTPMRQWRTQDPLVIQRGLGPHLFDTDDNRYIDGTSSLWCNVHGHNHPHLNHAITEQLHQVAHTTMLGLTNPPATQLAHRLIQLTDQHLPPTPSPRRPDFSPDARLTKVFYTDAGATAVEVALKMALGYHHHTSNPHRDRFVTLGGAYHGDTAGAMSVGYSDLFHNPFKPLTFAVSALPHNASLEHTQNALQQLITPKPTDSIRGHTDPQDHDLAAVILEPVVQGAAGMIVQPPGFVRMVRDFCDQHDTLLIADEVATGFGRTGKLFACEHDAVTPDILCLAKGLTAGYLPLAATLTTDRIAAAFEGNDDPNSPDFHKHRTLYHGHTYTGNPLAAAVALAGLDLFEPGLPNVPQDRRADSPPDLLAHINQSADLITQKLAPLHDHPHIIDIRQAGLMVGIELAPTHTTPEAIPLQRDGAPHQPHTTPPASGAAATVCHRLRDRGVILRPLGNVLVLMPIPATPHHVLEELLNAILAELHALN